ncbi:acyltransferase family protein [Streptococcus ovuberis]|uniref:Acyltransferase n=1 Tax=Streptococcus ovuberis TaxID=1936207 RepID=A0A7X6N033_9STRE|nr:acyltransferase family protein [Streptococcus ovuberis]NKZ19762.1 acyltransferase [Streptococcus ovuberis]
MRIKWFSLVRITGMVMVLLYHFWPSIFRGGFVGVDLFLTFSGFLTTALFLEEFSSQQHIDLFGFYRRRLYRIFPPLTLMLLVVLPFTLLIRSDFRAGLASQMAAVLGFVTNYFEIATGGSYENQFVPHLFVHTWTLAMEVQLYLVWGLVIWGLSRIATNKEQLRGLIFAVASIGFLVTFVRLIWGSIATINLSWVYYATGKHGFTFFLGAILACFMGMYKPTVLVKHLFQKLTLTKTLGLFAGASLVLVALTFLLTFESVWTYWVGFLLTSVATLAMIFSARQLHDLTIASKEPVFLTYLANISYGIYLFHWPFLIIFSEMGSRAIAVGLSLLFSFVFSSLSFYLLEPLIMGKEITLFGVNLTFKQPKKVLGVMAAPLVLLAFLLALMSPRIGALEKDLMVQGLEQADTKMGQLRIQVDGQKASDYGVVEGVMVIGDSVALRASDGITKAIPDALVDGEVSRTLEGAYDVMMATAKNKALPQTLVIAAGTNTVQDYQEQLDRIVKDMPQGHHLILVTPYDGRVAGNPGAIANLTRDYELSLAEKYDWITVADWYKVASNNPKIWHYTDYVHFGSDSDSIADGQALYAKMLTKAIAKAQEGSVKKHH